MGFKKFLFFEASRIFCIRKALILLLFYMFSVNFRGQANSSLLINNLETIKEELSAGKVPDNTQMGNLNQTCAKVHMFGQYVARIFDAIN